MTPTDSVETATDRTASLPDQPDAPLADRLLLALGIDPADVRLYLTEDDAVAIAAQHRSDAAAFCANQPRR